MTVYIAGRQTGKTTHLIKISEKTGAVIVAPTYQMVRYIDQMARELRLRIPPPVSVVDWVKMVARKQADPEQRYLVDELQMVLHQMNVDVATLSEDYKEEVRIGYIVLFTESGSVVGRFVVDGKVSSLNSYLTPDSEEYSSSYSRWIADVDGSYGENDAGIFFFTPDGKYVEWTGTYLYSDIPFEVDDPVVKVGG